MSETRVRAATLLSRVFLHYLVMLSETDDLLELWLKIITIMDRLINSGQGDNLVGHSSSPALDYTLTVEQEEAVAENLKNMLLVLSSGGYLVPPDEKPEKEELWNETWKRINRFLPNFFAELFPEEAKKPKVERKAKEAATKEKENEQAPVEDKAESAPEKSPEKDE